MTTSTTPETAIPTFTRSSSRAKLLLLLAAGAVVFYAALFKIADLDFWWHLKTGQIIWQQKAFQHQEIYSYTAAGRPYIDHEWLFQVLQYGLYSLGGPAAVILFKCLLLTIAYLLIAGHLFNRQTGFLVAVLVLFLSVAAARPRFIERPEIFTALFLVLLIVLVESALREGKSRKLWWILPIIVLWSNIHAAVILGLIVELAFFFAISVQQALSRAGYYVWYPNGQKILKPLLVITVLSFIVSGLNPCGYQVLLVPFQLTSIIESGLLQNQEWQQPSPLQVPFFYCCVAVTFVVHAIHFRKLHVASFLLSAFFGYISLKYVRNIGIFGILMPLLVAPYISGIAVRMKNYRPFLVGIIAGLLLFIIFRSPFESGFGEASYFPAKIVRYTKEKNLQGNLLNSYAFGGYFIWHLYPARRVFIDGRNEVYLPLIRQIVAARADSRKWRRLLSDYQVEYALLNYVDPLEELRILQKDGSFVTTYAPFSSTHFPRTAWALIYWDDTGMVLVKRNGANRALLTEEYTAVFPEGYDYQLTLARSGKIDVNKALEELNRKLKEDPNCHRARRLFDSLGAAF